MGTKGKNPEKETGNTPKTGRPTQTDGNDAMEQLLEKTQSFHMGAALVPAEEKAVNVNAKCKGAFAVAAAQDNWDLLEVKRIVAEAKRDFYG
ncbi:hypothetical protein CGRA01v4_06473 [Colletotrichum graminicola]|uniref:Uncharacterized protein n=1 Tax=Colletotrichum graminicola (strain M1.001 / M2 / FGSC 10212) TaxID=645133 RepID=E3Q287_COLGM|nr:uncharacterized protein GLRG_00332 [Colletotrichum graminicola M1.001]EFQ25188.1 hypothetical protein GLRG_00332 [Colletotrichum graminicola M1.001]WDK15192.1 hypothetical protein CGRA01v4_06473 [Colletotrichum graminicola]